MSGTFNLDATMELPTSPDSQATFPRTSTYSTVGANMGGLDALEDVLHQEFIWELELEDTETATNHTESERDDKLSWHGDSQVQYKPSDGPTNGRRGYCGSLTQLNREIMTDGPKFWSKVIENKLFEVFFLLLTVYAMFTPDLDLLFGSKESQVNISIATTFVCFFFLVEIILQVKGRPQYTCGVYFWLDIISFCSMLPDTWFMMLIVSNGQFVAARSSKFTQFLVMVTKSSKGARLNRWRRMARVAAFLPRLQRLRSNAMANHDTERLLDKKLERIFHYLDEDLDGYISLTSADNCVKALSRLISGQDLDDATSWAAKAMKNFQKSYSRSGTWSVSRSTTASSSMLMRWTMRSQSPSVTGSQSSAMVEEFDDLPVDRSVKKRLNFAGFRRLVLASADAAGALWYSCRLQVQKGNNMHSVTSRKTDFIAVKVALAILFLLFLLSFIQDKQEDTSAYWGLTSVDRLVRRHFSNRTDGSVLPLIVQEQLRVWSRDRTLLYLDLDKRIYCNDFATRGPACASLLNAADAVVGSLRTSLDVVDQELRLSSYRSVDLVLLRVPELAGTGASKEELERRTTAVAVLDGRKAVESAARTAMLTTTLVVLFILVGIGSLVRDLSWFSRNLLRPLVEISDEMESISRLQLAAFSTPTETTSKQMVGELRIIRESFESFKAGVISWGRYVPWPVVQLLMRKGAGANLEVKDVEVTVFFSDIASFTSIVENLPPERSLELLSRYFHDMSKIIDDYKGIVIDYVGDAIFAVYGAPVKNEEHPTYAVKAAVHMLRSLRSMNEWFVENDLPVVSIRCGIHTGTSLVGNMGFHSRMKYGVVGEESEIPSYLEEMNKNYSTRLLISQATVNRLIPETVIIRPIDIVYLREATPGHERTPEVVYEVLERNSTKPDVQQLHRAAQVHAAAFHYYRKMKFQKAIPKFERSFQMMTDFSGEQDVPSSMLLKRCQAYLEQPPSPDWDGVWDRERLSGAD